MSPSFRLFALAFVLPSLVIAAGCGGKGDRNIVPVAGTVMYKGQPVEGANVTFVSDESSRVSYGKTDADGRFQLTTVTHGDGALIGTHKVTIMKHEIVGEVPPEGGREDGPDYEKYEDAPIPKTRSLLPDRYSRPNTSDLTANVEAGGDNDFSFDLSD